MLPTVEGIYRNGRIELLETTEAAEGSRVVVTFLTAPTGVDLGDRGIDETQAADLRRRLGIAAGDWERPEMDIYDEL